MHVCVLFLHTCAAVRPNPSRIMMDVSRAMPQTTVKCLLVWPLVWNICVREVNDRCTHVHHKTICRNDTLVFRCCTYKYEKRIDSQAGTLICTQTAYPRLHTHNRPAPVGCVSSLISVADSSDSCEGSNLRSLACLSLCNRWCEGISAPVSCCWHTNTHNTSPYACGH